MLDQKDIESMLLRYAVDSRSPNLVDVQKFSKEFVKIVKTRGIVQQTFNENMKSGPANWSAASQNETDQFGSKKDN